MKAICRELKNGQKSEHKLATRDKSAPKALGGHFASLHGGVCFQPEKLKAIYIG